MKCCSVSVVSEGCWAIRSLASDTKALDIFAQHRVGELMCTVLFRHSEVEIVIIEALRVLCLICQTMQLVEKAGAPKQSKDVPNHLDIYTFVTKIHTPLLKSFVRVIPRNSANTKVLFCFVKVNISQFVLGCNVDLSSRCKLCNPGRYKEKDNIRNKNI
jgi:hypothetical protein